MAFHLKQLTDNPSRTTSRHRSKRPPITRREAKARAARLLTDGRISATQQRVLASLAVAGVLSEAQLHRLLGVSGRSLRRYQQRHLLDRLYIFPPKLQALGLENGYPRLYKLGQVGLAIAQHDQAQVPSGYEGFGVHKLTHDVLANELLLRVTLAAVDRGFDPIWLNKYEATVHDDSGRATLEPDGMLVLRHERDATRRILLEYHNEDDGRRTAEKVRRYEEAIRDGHWRRAWNCDAFPTILISWSHNAVATGYQEAIAQQHHRHLGLRGRYLGMPITRLLAGADPLLWKSFHQSEVVDLLA